VRSTCSRGSRGYGMNLKHSLLGKPTEYVGEYDPGLLFPISRQHGREEIGVGGVLPFFGVDIWNAYEMSWLDWRGKPHIAVATFAFPADSPNIVESKSFKLYLGSFSRTRFESLDKVVEALKRDLCQVSGSNVSLHIIKPSEFYRLAFSELEGTPLDELEVEADMYFPDASLLVADHSQSSIEEVVFSDLLKSNCPMTGQPDWASVQIHYAGAPIDHTSLLRYIVSYRGHAGFHEQCVEQIFTDIAKVCRPEKLAVYARYTRRGGLDINPYRSNFSSQAPHNARTARQ
jgi:7-cyano-7-deazaguanine reductase